MSPAGPLRVALALAAVSLGCGGDSPPSSPADRPAPAGPPEGLTQVAWGERLFQQQGCVGCHQINRHRSVGPPLGGLWGSERRLSNDDRVTVDGPYVRRAILRPDAERVAGYEAQMLSYKDVLGPAQLDALVAYVRSLK